MRATIEWSERLLEEPERTLFRRLSVFAGGFSAEAAEAVCRLEGAPELDTFEGLSSLVEKSLLRQEEAQGEEPRFSMLESVREYAGERLEEGGEAEAIREQHAEYYAGDPHDVERFWSPLESVDKLRRVNVELENVRAALDWAHKTQSPLELALAVQYQRGDTVFPAEGRLRLERALASPAPQPPQLRARALAAAGGLAHQQGDLAAARPYHAESLRLFRESGYEIGEGQLLLRLTVVALNSGNQGEALRLIEEQEALARRSGNPFDLGSGLYFRAILALAHGELGKARELLERCLEISQIAEGGYIEGFDRLMLARLAILEGHFDEAIAQSETSLQIAAPYGSEYALNWEALDVLAAALAGAGELDTGVRVYSTVSQRREARGEMARTSMFLRTVREQTHGRLEEALDLPEFATAVAEGRRLNVDEAIAIALTAAHRIVPATHTQQR